MVEDSPWTADALQISVPRIHHTLSAAETVCDGTHCRRHNQHRQLGVVAAQLQELALCPTTDAT